MILVFFPFFLLILTVQGQIQEDLIVECYSSAADCTSNTNGVSLAAIDCCNRTGGGYISHPAAHQCGACVVVGFDQSRVHIGPSDAGRRYSFTADVLLSTPGAPDVTGLDYVISRQPVMLVNVTDYLSSDFAGRTNGFLPERFSIQYVSQGNAVALQPILSFNYTIAAETSWNDPAIPSGVVLVYRRLSITIDDIDIITVGLQEPSIVLEGSIAIARVERQIIAYEAPFEVTVSNERYTGPLSQDEAAVGDFDFFNFTEQHSVVFQPATLNEQRFEVLMFMMPRDNSVELQEAFRWRLSVNDSRVRIDSDTRIVRLDNQDVFSIGFKDLHVTIKEGEVAPLTIKQLGNETGGVGIGGFPEGRLSPIRLRYVSGTATIDSDFSLNITVPRLTYRDNYTLNDIPFQPITSIDDNIIEGDETIRVIIVPGTDNVVQVQRDQKTATITIIDNDSGVLSLERGTYEVIENEGTVEICAVLTGGVLPTDTVITMLARSNSARFRSDYMHSPCGSHPILPAFANRTCGKFNIINDTIREQLLENFTVEISSIFPENSGLTIDRSPSFIRIQDDDLAQQLQEDEIVQCYSSAADCTSNTNRVSLAAIDCCNRTGGGYISYSSLNAETQCGACIVVGFDQSRVHIGPRDAGRRYSFTADVLLSTPGASTNEVRELLFNISQQPETLVNAADFLMTPVFRGQDFATLPTNFSLQYVSQGNAVALQPTLSFDYSIELSSSEKMPLGVVLVYKRLSITINDIDTMPVHLQVFPFLAEGITAQVYIKRQKINFLTPFEVTLSYEKHQGLGNQNQALGDFDNFNFSKQSVLFDPIQDKNVIAKSVPLMVPVDNVVELSEVFLMKISATSAHVKITSVTTYPFIVDSGDVFRIGIKDINISVMEGGTPVLTIQQIGDERGGEAIGGLPENKIQPIVLRHEGGNTTRGGLQSDFSFNPTVPKLTYSANNTLNDITFTPITSIDDNIIEGNETIRVIIVPGGDRSNDPNDHNVQVELKWQTATITIIDNDSGVLSLERGTYDVIENEGTVEICAVLTGGVLSTDTVITLQARDNTAVWNNLVQGQLQEDVIVECYSSAADCTSNTNGVSLAAIDCCNRTGGGYIRHSSLAAQCGACVIVGFDQSRVHIGPSDADRRYSFTADVLLSTPGAPDVTCLDYTISREPAVLVDVVDYLSSDFRGRTNGFLPERFSIRYASYGNGVALQPTLSFNYTIAAETDAAAGDPPIPSGVVLVYRRLSITIKDMDMITVGLIGCTCFLQSLEGSYATAVIRRQLITYETPFEVTVSLEKWTGTMTGDEAAVGDF
uniref:Calx-beta domain-containing protein n=1 Tax=Amphimedon queenslandica TaxID=400682 RepID=A0A1X7U353_AMPQE